MLQHIQVLMLSMNRLLKPTFVFQVAHRAHLSHARALEVLRELFEIGLEDYFHKGGVCLVEWADLIEDLLPEDTITINLSYGHQEGERICSIDR